jgi:hypothetical protein
VNILQELEKLDREIARSTREMNQAEGKKEAKIETLKKEFRITPKQVNKKVGKIEAKLKEVGTEIETKFKGLREEYSWE